MAATNKDALLTVTKHEFDKLLALIGTVDQAKAVIKVDDVSIKDVIGHRAAWITLFMGWYRDGQAGREVHIPARGYKWNQLNAFNAALRTTQADMTWDDVQVLLVDAERDLVALIKSLSNDALYSGPMIGGTNKWTTGRWAEAAGPSHFRSAAKFIRTTLKTL